MGVRQVTATLKGEIGIVSQSLEGSVCKIVDLFEGVHRDPYEGVFNLELQGLNFSFRVGETEGNRHVGRVVRFPYKVEIEVVYFRREVGFKGYITLRVYLYLSPLEGEHRSRWEPLGVSDIELFHQEVG